MGQHEEGFSNAGNYVAPGRIAAKIICRVFQRNIKVGQLFLQFPTNSISIGQGNPVCSIEPPTLWRFARMVMRADLNVADHYVRGYWNCDMKDLYHLLVILFQNRDSNLWRYFSYVNERNPLRDSVIYRLFPKLINKNTAFHYSSNTDFMRIVLGDTLLYTCAFFDSDADKLDNAQLNKVHTVASRLQIEPSDDVLELGCGWGNTAEIISEDYKCKVTGVNLTSSQIDYAKKNSGHDTHFINSNIFDFDPGREFDRIYSIGMLEHIGVGLHSRFFAKVARLLKPGGTALIHCIVREKPGATNAWIDSAVFPGGYIPLISDVVRSIEQNRISIKDIFIHHKSNYFRTLKSWRENFFSSEKALREILLRDLQAPEVEKIMRMWNFYLAVSQLSFSPEHGTYQTAQFSLQKN
ncbi:MAG: cyclopropane-fatty-acyl-phospholipid synthase family protein [Rhodobacter sp.]|nr:cyclopropane-fatty-acyl-phospholipid synthase family protein [Rhodobacter sp.]